MYFVEEIVIMKTQEELTLTLEEATSLLAEKLTKLAMNAVFEKRLVAEVEVLENYIKSLEAKEQPKAEDKKDE